MKTLSKARLIEKIDQRGLGYSKEELGDFINSFIGILSDTLINGEEMRLSKFGNFIVKDKVARVGRNPNTDEKLIISRRKVVSFKASPVLNQALNHGKEHGRKG